MGAVSLRALVPLWRGLGMVAGADLRRRILSSVLGAGVCFVLGMGRGLWLRIWLGRLGRLWLAPDRTLRLVPSLVGWISRTLRRGRCPRGIEPLWWICSAARGDEIFEHRKHS